MRRIVLPASSGLATAAALFCLLTGCGKKDHSGPTEIADGPAQSTSAVSQVRFDPATVPGRIHVVQPSETLWSLAEMYYGNSRQWRKILIANRRRVTDPTNLPVGMKLIIP